MKDLNLIPKSYILKKKQKTKKVLFALSVSGLCILIIAAIALPLGYKYTLKKRSDSLSITVSKGSVNVETLKQLNAVKAMYKILDDEGNMLKTYGAKSSKLFEELEKIIPMRFFITSMTFSNKTGKGYDVTLSCISETEEDSATFINCLRHNSSFSNIDISSIKKTTIISTPVIIKNAEEQAIIKSNKYFTFTINLTYKAGV